MPIRIGQIGRAGSIKLRDLLLSEIPTHGSKVLLQQSFTASTNNHIGHARPLQQQVEYNLPDRFPMTSLLTRECFC